MTHGRRNKSGHLDDRLKGEEGVRDGGNCISRLHFYLKFKGPRHSLLSIRSMIINMSSPFPHPCRIKIIKPFKTLKRLMLYSFIILFTSQKPVGGRGEV